MRVGGLVVSVRLRAGSRKGIRRGRRGGTGFLEDWFEGGGGGGSGSMGGPNSRNHKDYRELEA